MPDQRTISTSQTADSVTLTVMSSGQAIPSTIGIQNVSVWHEINRVSKARLIILDGNPAQQDFEISAQDLFVPGKEISIQAGYHSDEEQIFNGIVTKHSIKIRKNGRSQLIVDCHHKAVKMTQNPKSRYYYDSTESDIWEQIIDEYQISKEVTSSEFVQKEVLQYQSTDWDYLVSRAEVNGLMVITGNDQIKIAPPDFDQDITETVSYGSTLLSLDAEIDAFSQVSGVTGKTWDYSKTEPTEIEAISSSPTTPGNLGHDALSGVFSEDPMILRNSAKQPDEVLQKWANATLQRHELAKVRGRAQFQGIPQIEAGKTIELQGLGDRFSGTALISGVRHEISSGNWLSDVQFGLSPKSHAENYPISSKPASGMLPAISGLQIGIVTQIEGDPEGDDRIMLSMPVVDMEEQGIWARMSTYGAGDSRGIIVRPEIGDEVIVGFINDDPSHPIILGALNSSNLPSPIPASDDNFEKGWVSMSELSMIINDEKKSIEVKTPVGKVIKIDEDEGEILLEDDYGNSIKMNDDGITIESGKDIILRTASGDMTIEANNVDLKAQASAKIDASSSAELSASGSTTIKGGIVQIN